MAAVAPANMKEMATNNGINARRITGSFHRITPGAAGARPY
jgi:hypothetical protein